MTPNLHRISLLLIFAAALNPSLIAGQAKHTFALGERDFLLDGKPFQIIAGEMHFARIPREYWRQRLRMARAMGLNTISTYVFWNYQEPEEGKFDFVTENRNIAEFIRIAGEEGLWVILRPGPYACAEWDFGGYPWWLLKEKDLIVRGKDPRFLRASGAYLKRLGEEVAPLQVTRGGPIILVQVENEYGSYGSDKEFMAATRDQIRAAGFEVPLFTADGPSQCRNAFLPDVLPAINGEENLEALHDTVNTFHGGKGPYFVPEYYPGWLDHWGEQHSVLSAKEATGKYDTLLAGGASVSLYMFHGGTNFGFMSGANYGGHYQPQPTSYDYDAPLDEAGRPTPKYHEFRRVIAKHLPSGSALPEVPPANRVIEIPAIAMPDDASVFDSLPPAKTSRAILPMEECGEGEGYILYRTTITTPGESDLFIDDLRDYGIIFLNGRRISEFDRRHRHKRAKLNVTSVPSTMDILVENGGRVNYGRQLVDNRKGITNRVLLNDREVTDWQIFPLPMHDLSALRFTARGGPGSPAFRRGRFPLTDTGDTFLDLRGWGKGVVWVNGHNLGRYWYIGPQQTLYCPGVWLRKGENEIIALDIENRGMRSIAGLKYPILDQLNPDLLAPLMPKRERGTVRLEQSDLKAEGTFAAGDSEQTVRFAPVRARYVCIQSLSSLRSDPFASVAEFYVLDAQGKKAERGGWKVQSLDSEELIAEDGRGENALDDEAESIWHTQWGAAKPPHPHYLAIDMGRDRIIGGFVYQSRLGNAPGKIKGYRFYARQEAFQPEGK